VKYVDEREPRVVQQEEEDSLMPKQEVMSKLGVTHATLWNWANKNYLVPVKVGRKVFYHKADIDHLCESKK
jgi:predicted DNA-binding transcriptional regulator AlpA